MNAIDIQRLTKDYGRGKGVFDITLSIQKGEVYGYLGPNGAGKSTTLRHLMGFIKPQTGAARIEGMDCWQEQKKIQPHVGYLPGEIAFPDNMSGLSYLKLIARMRKMKDFSHAKKLLSFFEIDPNINVKKMSKGMKQKIGIVAAFMHNPDILLLDEPTSGLDPLMRNRFIELVEEEKNKGKTILLSSHIFDEVEKTCDRIGMIRNGTLVEEVTADQLCHSQFKTYTVKLLDDDSFMKLQKAYPDAKNNPAQRQITVSVIDSSINHLINALSQCRVASLTEEKHTLEEYFMKFYGGNEHDQHSLF